MGSEMCIRDRSTTRPSGKVDGLESRYPVVDEIIFLVYTSNGLGISLSRAIGVVDAHFIAEVQSECRREILVRRVAAIPTGKLRVRSVPPVDVSQAASNLRRAVVTARAGIKHTPGPVTDVLELLPSVVLVVPVVRDFVNQCLLHTV